MATFSLPDGLAPEIYPLAWLVGPWRGYGVLSYPDVPEQPFVHEMTFDHDGGPYLRCTSTIWTVDAEGSASVPNEASGAEGAELLSPGAVWSTETSYWRGAPEGGGEPPEPAAPRDPEGLAAQPSGCSVWSRVSCCGWKSWPPSAMSCSPTPRDD